MYDKLEVICKDAVVACSMYCHGLLGWTEENVEESPLGQLFGLEFEQITSQIQVQCSAATLTFLAKSRPVVDYVYIRINVYVCVCA